MPPLANPPTDETPGTGWHAFFAVAIAMGVVVCLIDRSVGEGALVLAGAFLIAASYVWRVGRPGRDPHGVLLVGSSVVGVALVALASPAAAFFLPAIVPQLFWFTGVGVAVPTVLVVFALAGVGLIRHEVEPYGWSLVPLGLGALLSVVAGAWISQIVTLSASRAEALAELADSQAELARVSHEAGASAERARMAQEVHDGVTQRLTVVRMLLEAAQRRTEAGATAAAQDRTRLALDHVVAALGELRALLTQAGEVDLPSASLRDSVTSAVDALTAGTDIAADVRIDLPAEPTPEVAHVLLRVLREALSNIAAHAGARHVEVLVEPEGHSVMLRVRDDGVGFTPQEGSRRRAEGHGYGLTGMRERTGAIGGTLVLDTAPGAGTTITATFPTSRAAGPPAPSRSAPVESLPR